MKTITYYECEICGEQFKDEEDCHAHEVRHRLGDLFTSGAKFYDANGRLLTIDNIESGEDFADVVHGIDCPSVEVAEVIKEIFDDSGYGAPFDEIGASAAPCRVMYNSATYSWFNADEELARIKRQFGEK